MFRFGGDNKTGKTNCRLRFLAFTQKEREKEKNKLEQIECNGCLRYGHIIISSNQPM